MTVLLRKDVIAYYGLEDKMYTGFVPMGAILLYLSRVRIILPLRSQCNMV